MDILTLAPSNGLAFYLVIFVLFLVGQIRVLLYKSKRPWTNKIGGKWLWISVAAIISTAICVGFKINIAQDVFNIQSIGSLQLDGYVGYVVSGLAVSFSSNISAWAAERPHKIMIKDLEEGKPVPGSEESLQTSSAEEHWSTPPVGEEKIVEESKAVEIPMVIPTPEVHVKFLTPWMSDNKPEFLLLEENGTQRIIKFPVEKVVEKTAQPVEKPKTKESVTPKFFTLY